MLRSIITSTRDEDERVQRPKQRGRLPPVYIAMYHDLDNELIRAWQLLHELSESNARNRDLAVGLHNVADVLKVFFLARSQVSET